MRVKIIEFKPVEIFNRELIEDICRKGYKKTGRKFWITFQGSKGYVNHIEICCEGGQRVDKNVIELADTWGYQNNIALYFDSECGIQIKKVASLEK